MKKRISVFASGSGTNAENIANYFKNSQVVEVSLVLSNNRKSGVLDKMEQHGISTICFNRAAFYENPYVLNILKNQNPSLIVLAGFLWKFPEPIIAAFSGKIINIHPSLLPKYGGKGMYGLRVHEAVHKNQERETGITIHHVTANYDEGPAIFQARTALSATDTPEAIEQRVRALEYEHFPKIIESLI